nr:hypothetical protein [Micromonospora sp. DSM 115978]
MATYCRERIAGNALRFAVAASDMADIAARTYSNLTPEQRSKPAGVQASTAAAQAAGAASLAWSGVLTCMDGLGSETVRLAGLTSKWGGE